ncbi:TadE/TadG family type IV pilus assembly protein [Sphingomonas corticis]|jgi:Flp pilus assembly protein TadG|uniref:Pilus assembly protein n=1 Tax=Sphingomonas corticis TaxID=2722791 RepID=A0ABX1CRN7_9SPHN|nr:TadE/TadG family type IV pilus assembly protein [Sphingomonas corticis]NJR79042.1 pilus assembly protein [Sphingomonas corticis]
MIALTRRSARRLARDRGGIAMIEFALVFPLFLLFMLGAVELTNFITVKLRVSQLALQIADNAARIGAGSPLAAKQISEADINDLFTGAQLASTQLDLLKNGRVILSDLEPQANPNTAGRYKIVWQRCFGTRTAYASSYGRQGDQNLTGIGPTGRQATAQDDNATMFVEVRYRYAPIISTSWTPVFDLREIASMAVRDRRDLTRVYNNERVAAATC